MRRRASLPLLATAAAVVVGTVAAVAVTGHASVAAHRMDEGWVGTWSAAPAPPGTSGRSATGFADQTLREIVHTSAGGSAVRVRLTNVFGTGPLTVNSVTVALRATGASVVAGTDRPVTFDGSRTVVIPPGAETFSDPVPLAVPAQRDLAVSLFVAGPTGPTTWHATASTTSYYATGDHTADVAGTAYPDTTTSWYLLDGVDVRAPVPGSVVALGDSITDGTNSTVDADRTWPDDLARRLGGRLGVLEEGISGNRVLTDAGSSGVNVQARFDRDVLAQTGVRDVILLEGINDIGHDLGPTGQPVTAQDVIDGLTAVIRAAHEHGLRITGGTLTPIGGSKYDTPAAESVRAAVNAWIRTSGAFDNIVDFDRVVRDPADPARFAPAFDSGDHLHPNDDGYQAMADSIDLGFLSR